MKNLSRRDFLKGALAGSVSWHRDHQGRTERFLLDGFSALAEGQCHYTLFDSNWTTYAQQFKMHGCSRLYPFENQADPIEELAEKLGLPADQLKATVDHYNDMAYAGEDTEGNPIPGLYVVGNDSGGYFANTYPNLSTGMACGRTVTFGYLVGKQLAQM